MPCDRCVTRREFLGRASVGLAVGLVATGCGDGVVSGIAPRPSDERETVSITVADFPALATPGVLVKVSSYYAAKRTGGSTFDAFSMVCTHQGCLTVITDGQRFDCPCHNSRFDANGSRISGPATQPLLKLTTSYDQATDVLTIS